MTLTISPLRPENHADWEILAHAYKDFYQTAVMPAEYDTAWNRLLAHDGVFGIGAFMDGKLAGIAHYLFHTTVWAPTSCYLQDLFVSPDARGRGVARALIEAVAEAARTRGASRYYWLTQDHNVTARALYDKVAQFKGFIRYDYVL